MRDSSPAGPCLQVQLALDERGLPLPPDLMDHLRVCKDCAFAARLSSLLAAGLSSSAGKWFSAALGQDIESGAALLLDRYRLEAYLGGGSQGRVYLATDVKLRDTLVALKIVRLDPHSVDEVVNGRQINHPDVCRINHTAECGTLRLIEMEYIAGPTLAERLNSLSQQEAAEIFRALCEGMIAVHEGGVLHLDLKPKNIMLRRGVQPVIMDFGLSARMGGPPRGGTKKYMAPELALGDCPDARADVYSLGVLLSEMMPRRSWSLRAVIDRATATRPKDRYGDVRSLLAAFAAASRWHRRAIRWGILSAAAAGLVATVSVVREYVSDHFVRDKSLHFRHGPVNYYDFTRYTTWAQSGDYGVSFTLSTAVRNDAFHKQVGVRWTVDHWATQRTDILFYKGTIQGLFERWEADLHSEARAPVEGVDFAVFVNMNGTQYWDNNNGKNYRIPDAGSSNHMYTPSPAQGLTMAATAEPAHSRNNPGDVPALVGFVSVWDYPGDKRVTIFYTTNHWTGGSKGRLAAMDSGRTEWRWLLPLPTPVSEVEFGGDYKVGGMHFPEVDVLPTGIRHVAGDIDVDGIHFAGTDRGRNYVVKTPRSLWP